MIIVNRRNLEKLLTAAKAAGCPHDQVKRLLQAGYVPQPKQLQFHAAARAADGADGPTHIALGGDRGGAKSHTIMSQVALDDCQRYPGLDVLYLRKVGKTAKKALDQLRAKTFIHIPHTYNRNEGIIRFHESGATIVVGHFKDDRDIDQYVGLEYDIIVIEEATQLSQSKTDQLLGSLRTGKPGWRPRSYRAANPGGIGHTHFRQTFVIPYRQQQETDTRFIPMSWRDNAFINPEYKKYLMGLTGTLGRMWRDGDWDVGVGQFFTNWNYDTHVKKPFKIPDHWPIWLSLDYGHAHPTAVYWHTTFDGNIYTIAEHVQARWLPPRHARRIKAIQEMLQRPLDSIEVIVAGHDCFAQKGDKQGRTIADQYQEEGIPLTRANVNRVAGAAEMLKRLGNPAAGIRPTWFIFNTCPHLIACLPAMLSDPKRPEDVLKVDANDEGEGGDDPYDAARYGLMYKQQTTAGGLNVQLRR